MKRSRDEIIISEAALERQREYMRRVNTCLSETGGVHLAMVDTYGCQQNEADSERMRGMLVGMGYTLTEDEREAEVIVINTCAVREHAEQRVLGNVGALNHTKKNKPDQIIVLCGCMVQQEGKAQQIKLSYPIVDIVFGPDEFWRLPEFLWKRMNGGKRIFETAKTDGHLAEGLPVVRMGGCKAWVSIMYGCDNFCTYCIVPYVRGRNRSREPEKILEEVRGLVAEGVKEITLLGQNVNSYGLDLENGMNFAALLREIDKIEGDHLIRFMTSHPRDATPELIDAMAECPHIAHQLHLPVQSGSDRVLKVMNRHYTRAEYLKLIDYARERMPDLVITSDIIVGFPGETEEELMETISLIERVRYDALFTFIYSPRVGTPAAAMPDPYTREEKQVWFDRLLDVQNRISGEKHAEYVGNTYRVLVDGLAEGKEYNLSSRTNGGRLVHLTGDPALIGSYVTARVTDSNTWALYGEITAK